MKLKIALALSLSLSILMTCFAYSLFKQKLDSEMHSKTLQKQLEKTMIELVTLRNELHASQEKTVR